MKIFRFHIMINPRRKMMTKIFCKTVAKGTQAFFVQVNGKNYYLFQQAFKRSNKEYFAGGVEIHSISKFSNVHSTAVRDTLDKLPAYIRYVESEHGVSIYEKTKLKEKRQKLKTAYKRTPFLLNQYNWEVA